MWAVGCITGIVCMVSVYAGMHLSDKKNQGHGHGQGFHHHVVKASEVRTIPNV